MITPSFALTATERVLPRLALDFTTAALDPRITFTRAGDTATVVNSSGYVVGINANLPRFDYNPLTLVCKGLLIEESRTNLAFQSNAFDDTTYWTRSNLASVDPDVSGVVSPQGIENADKIVENTTASVTHGIGQSFTASGGAVTYSFYVKNNGRNIQVYFRDAPFSGTLYGQAIINTGAGTVTSSTDATVQIQSFPNGWLRVSLTSTVTVPAGSRAVAIRLVSGTSTVTYTGDGTSGVYLYGAQIEAGAFATSYIPTVASQVTRTADVATMTGTNFSDWYNASEGAFEIDFNPYFVAGAGLQQSILSVSDGTINNAMDIYKRNNADTSTRLNVVVATAPQVFLNAGVLTTGNNKVTMAYKLDSYAFCRNALNVLTDSAATVPTVNRLAIGTDSQTSIFALEGHVQRLKYWPQRLINAEVQAFSK